MGSVLMTLSNRKHPNIPNILFSRKLSVKSAFHMFGPIWLILLKGDAHKEQTLHGIPSAGW